MGAPRAGELNESQDTLVWAGLELLGCTRTSRLGIKNNVRYVVREVGAEGLRVESTEGTSFPLTFAQATSLLRLAFAQTYASCQGTEFSGSLCLHDTDNPHFSRRHLFVALSRAKAGCGIRVA